jgi:undecaprenyl-diphosphatase
VTPDLLLKAALLGLVEGATEFIPVSSTGHLIVVGEWLNLVDDRAKTFEIFIQLGAILAVVWLFRRRLVDTFRSIGKQGSSRRLVTNLIIAFLPAAVVGFLAHDWIKDRLFTKTVVAAALVIGGVAILLIERWAPRPSIGNVDEVPPQTALGIGLAQVLSLVPGTSRSAATIMGGYGLGLTRVAATEFSFFLAIPVMLAATSYDLLKSWSILVASDAPMFLVGFVVSFLAALIVIRSFLVYVSSHSFAVFAWYRIAFGAVLLLTRVSG